MMKTCTTGVGAPGTLLMNNEFGAGALGLGGHAAAGHIVTAIIS